MILPVTVSGAAVIVEIQCESDWDGLPTKAEFTRWVEAAVEEPADNIEIVLRIVDRGESEQLNERYRHLPGPTNVLSFPYADAGVADVPLPFGDLVICAPLVKAEAAAQGKQEKAHWAHMVVHGILHLRGFDHQSDVQASAMEAVEKSILESLGFGDPYATG